MSSQPQVTSLLNRLSANLREEEAGQVAIIACLADQRSAIDSGRGDRVEDATRAIRESSAAASRRATQRARVLQALSKAWHVPADALTLRSIAERAGGNGRSLLELRDRVRVGAATVQQECRRIVSLARVHRGVVQEVLGALLGEENLQTNAPGALVDAEG